VIYADVGINVGKGRTMGKSEIDERGRVTIPKEIREKAGLKAGDKLWLTADNKRVTIQKAVNLEKFIEELKGCITIKGDLDPLKLKEIWRTAE
jgi:AbrB family looped-hinge helix DNA binding protein